MLLQPMAPRIVAPLTESALRYGCQTTGSSKPSVLFTGETRGYYCSTMSSNGGVVLVTAAVLKEDKQYAETRRA